VFRILQIAVSWALRATFVRSKIRFLVFRFKEESVKDLGTWFTSPKTWEFIGNWLLMAFGALIMLVGLIALPDRITDNIMKQDRFGRIASVICLLVLLVVAAPALFAIIVNFASSPLGVVALIALIVLVLVNLPRLRRRRTTTNIS